MNLSKSISINCISQKELVAEIDRMMRSEFLQPNQIKAIDKKIDGWIQYLDGLFGRNDGEVLEQEGIDFIITLFKLRLMDYFAVLQK